jgi:hypothetical protein
MVSLCIFQLDNEDFVFRALTIFQKVTAKEGSRGYKKRQKQNSTVLNDTLAETYVFSDLDYPTAQPSSLHR